MECCQCGTDYRPDASDSTACPLCVMTPTYTTFNDYDRYVSIRDSYHIGALHDKIPTKVQSNCRKNSIYKAKKCVQCKELFIPDSPHPKCDKCRLEYKQNKKPLPPTFYLYPDKKLKFIGRLIQEPPNPLGLIIYQDPNYKTNGSKVILYRNNNIFTLEHRYKSFSRWYENNTVL